MISAVSDSKAQVVVIDSLNGFLNAMPEERFLIAQLHELLTYLGHHGVTTFLVVSQSGFLGAAMSSPLDASYLADNVILFRHFEAGGELRQLISVVKKRSGRHERALREYAITSAGIRIGVHTNSVAYSKQMIERGFDLVTVGSDLRYLMGARREVAEMQVRAS